MKLNKLLLLSASALLLAGCGNGGSTSSTQSAQQSTQSTTSVAPVTRSGFEHVLPANYEFEYSWESSLSTTNYKLTKMGDKYLSMADIHYNFFQKIEANKYKHYHKLDTDSNWVLKQQDMDEKRFQNLYLAGLYPNGEASYEKTGTASVTSDGKSFNVDVYKDSKHDIEIKYYETDTIKLVLERSDDSNLAKITKINESVSEFPIEVPQE